MDQSDFMNKNIEVFDTDLNDDELLQAVEAVLSNAVHPAPQSQLELAQPAPESQMESQTSVPAQQNTSSRFVNHQSFDQFLQEQQNSNTRKKTTNDVKLFQSYLNSQNETRYPQLIPPCDLDGHISGFLLSVRKRDGTEFEPSTLRSFVSSINRHLIMNGYKFSVMADAQFRRCREILAAKQKQLKSVGKGNKPRAADEITDDDIDSMYTKKVLGPDSPSSLIYSLWLICTLHFGMRPGKETHDLKWGDIQLRADVDGNEYLVYTQERQTKTRTGSNPRDVRKTKPRAYAIPQQPERDPVALYKKYRTVRPGELSEPDSPFFLSINYNYKNGHPWYKKQPMGINKLYQIMNDLKKGAGIDSTDKRLTAHSVRKHLVQKLTDEGLPPNQIMQITGHKNVNSLNNYSYLKPDQTKTISSILSNHPVKAPTTATATATCTSSATESSQVAVLHQEQATIPVPVINPGAFNPAALGGLFTGNTIHGNININFNQSQQLSRNTATWTSTCSSPRMQPEAELDAPVRKNFKRIRMIDSDSD